MVSFSCEVCNDTVVKKKLGQHQQRCRGAYFTCIDCSTTFHNNDHDKHTSCISEAEKYEKSLYKGKKKQPVTQKEQPKPKSVTEKSSPLASLVTEKSNFYKILKKASKDDKKKLKEILKNLTVSNIDGKLIIQ
ncbi:LYAR-type C2HC zinc finger family protein [Candida parapsilosis]|uniref:Zf-LYAR domain-containing protein n=2 Tax=Candida parapsilosis TaxID=5480 RepID=G8BEH2_CANPC|nr:uncharacterized protein CPAR2_200040 [Candida parapsilosis]KAF6055485.1 LYAR-type C2HC zinc finger family protein [Candida parapsilosis]KAF6055492.1 LYAR-type C2HC zinc finger family protein [Candida parapsilosis]KAF6058422.1 LYAR-type C2HC zinc finger family protein [Candida parapsilosis]KAF6067179.1 LYAR-type C2HC zinc finger family protein [Candida parapsilosis]KAI5903810.1 uncharacterized protein K4G60_g2967 [Candida parapsilosis]